MKIIVLDTLKNQIHNSSIPTDVIPRIFNEFQRLTEIEVMGRNAVEEYLKNHHGIKMQGADSIFKYEITDGDRILYTHSKDLTWLRHQVSDTYVLLLFSKHDDQGDEAKKFDMKKVHDYAYVKDIVESKKKKEIDVGNDNEKQNEVEDLVKCLKDYTPWHKADTIIDENRYKKLTPDEMEVTLSNEQDECISSFFENPGPTLIIGGAGTGKTLIAVHLLIDHVKNVQKSGINDNNDNRIRSCYFTQSPELRNKVIKLFMRYKNDIDSNLVYFHDINEYCIAQLGIKHKNVIYTQDFLNFIEMRPNIVAECNKKGISPIDIWTEIRGIIKGSMTGDQSNDWKRVQSMLQNEFNGNIKPLVDAGYFIRNNNDQKRISLVASLEETIKREKNDENLNKYDRENLHKAINYFSSFDHTIRTLTKEQYLSVPEIRTTVEKKERDFVWDVCCQYEEFLIQNSFYDENDLIRMMFEKGISTDSQFDFSIIDEVQDYTELQLFFIRQLTKGNNIVFAGDEHQNINPASFSESRLKSLFTQGNGTALKVKRLHKNYRCQQMIIDTANKLAEIRRVKIASGSAENEEPEISIRASDAKPLRFVYDDTEFTKCLCELLQYPKAVILVPNQDIKTYILKRIESLKGDIVNRIGESRYKARRDSAVFTVAEIKGMEYEYVLCFDLIGTYINEWQQIFKNVYHKTKYRYFFNLLYVSMTRAQEYLCFVDRKMFNRLEEKMQLNVVDQYDGEQLYINRLSTTSTEWYEQARKLEDEGKFVEALSMYEAAEAEITCIYRCKYHIAKNGKNYDEAIMYALLLDTPELIKGYLKDITSPALKKLVEAYICLKNEPLNYEFRRININRLIETCIEKEYRMEVKRNTLKALKAALQVHSDEISYLLMD